MADFFISVLVSSRAIPLIIVISGVPIRVSSSPLTHLKLELDRRMVRAARRGVASTRRVALRVKGEDLLSCGDPYDSSVTYLFALLLKLLNFIP